jgi:uncharacterized DUF497 family protein
MALSFEWDKRKAESNLRAHGVSVGEATTVFADPLSITISDPDHSSVETCFLDIGLSCFGASARGIVHGASQHHPPHKCATGCSE